MSETSTPQSSSHKLALAILGFCIMAIIVGMLNAFYFQGSEPGSTQPALAEEGKGSSPFSSFLGKGSIEQDNLMMVEVVGVITSQGESEGLFSEDSMARKALKALAKAEKDESVKGVLLFIDSPGGTVGMSQELNAAVKRVTKKKPVVASFGDMAASGGYYTAVAADKIVTNPGTITGSIGVIISNLNMAKLFQEKLGVQSVTVKSGKFKDILSPFRNPTGEEIQLVQSMIDESYQDFLAAVIEGRTKFITQAKEKTRRIDSIRTHADGRIILGSQAVRLGLADDLGDLVHARKVLNEMAVERFHLRGTKELPLEKYSEGDTLLDLLLAKTSAPMPKGESTQTQGVHIFPESMIPFSYRHPNQPLWILE